MPALPADILRAIRASRVVTRVDATLKTDFPTARDQSKDPQPGFFEDAADAHAALALADAVIGEERRRFTVQIGDEIWIDPMAGIPTFHLVDAEAVADLDVIPTRIELDMENETTLIEVMG